MSLRRKQFEEGLSRLIRILNDYDDLLPEIRDQEVQASNAVGIPSLRYHIAILIDWTVGEIETMGADNAD